MVKVFLVDDEIVIREGIRNSFPWEESGYTLVGEAPDGEIALPMIRDANPDILITDIRMPFMDGMQLCREVKRQMPWIGVVILSGYDDFTYARQAISLGVKEYLLKPVTAQELKEVLDRISARLTEERRAREDMALMRRRLHSGSQFVKEKLLSSLFTDEPMEDGDADAMIEQMRTLGINLAAKCYAVIDMAFSCADGSRSVPRAALYALAESSGGIVQVCAAKHGARAGAGRQRGRHRGPRLFLCQLGPQRAGALRLHGHPAGHRRDRQPLCGYPALDALGPPHAPPDGRAAGRGHAHHGRARGRRHPRRPERPGPAPPA